MSINNPLSRFRKAAPLSACLLISVLSNAAAYEIRTNGEGIRLHWEPEQLPIPYFIDRTGCPDVSDGSDVAAIQSAFQTWENVASGRLAFHFAGLIDAALLDPAASVVMWMQEEWPYEPRYVAKTRLYYDRESGRIRKVEMLLNGRDYRWSTNGAEGTLDVQNVATHEAGHFIGLGDIQGAGKTMFEYILLGENSKCFLADDDRDGLNAAYPLVGIGETLVMLTCPIDDGSPTLGAPAGARALPPPGNFVALVPLGDARSSFLPAAILHSRGGGFTLTAAGPAGAPPRDYPIVADAFGQGMVRAVSSLDLDGDGIRGTLAALVSTPAGLSIAAGAITSAAPLRLSLSPVAGADDVIAFTQLPSAEDEFPGALVMAEKRRGSEYYLSIGRAGRDKPEARGITLSRLRSWSVPGCARALGVAALAGSEGRIPIALLMKNSSGAMEIALYDPPFGGYPLDGAPFRPSRILDASSLAAAGRPVAFCGIPSGADHAPGRIAALVVR